MSLSVVWYLIYTSGVNGQIWGGGAQLSAHGQERFSRMSAQGVDSCTTCTTCGATVILGSSVLCVSCGNKSCLNCQNCSVYCDVCYQPTSCPTCSVLLASQDSSKASANSICANCIRHRPRDARVVINDAISSVALRQPGSCGFNPPTHSASGQIGGRRSRRGNAEGTNGGAVAGG